jgi:hypothetical protein
MILVCYESSLTSVRSEVLTALKMPNLVFQIVLLSGLVL